MFGMGMAMNSMGGNFGNIQNQPMQNQMPQQNYGYQQPVQQTPVTPTVAMWSCSCGTQNDGAFCKMCGSRKPEAGVQEKTTATWTCSCGRTNDMDSRFCPGCGSKKPTVKKYKCDKCGWEPNAEEGASVRFCPKCGDPFNDADVTEE
jgi:membrane protease subunit (stomatin/prohibitin family)